MQFYIVTKPGLLMEDIHLSLRVMAKDYIADLDEFERKCREKGILEGNVIWGLSAKDFPDLKPEDSSSLYYVGAEEIEICN